MCAVVVRTIRANGGFAAAFLVLALVLNCMLIAAGTVLYALGDPSLIKAALDSATIVTPAMTGAGIVYGVYEAVRAKAARDATTAA